jgi:hypothetical protein
VALDSSAIAELTAKLMDELDDAGVDGRIVDALIVLEIDDGEDHLTRLKCSSERSVIGMGLARSAELLYAASIDVERDDDED